MTPIDNFQALGSGPPAGGDPHLPTMIAEVVALAVANRAWWSPAELETLRAAGQDLWTMAALERDRRGGLQ